MSKRRSNAEIQAVRALNNQTFLLAMDITERVNPDSDTDGPYVSVRAANIGAKKAAFQSEIADDLIVSFTTKDPVLAEKMAVAIRAMLCALDK